MVYATNKKRDFVKGDAVILSKMDFKLIAINKTPKISETCGFPLSKK